jgi:signal peptidase
VIGLLLKAVAAVVAGLAITMVAGASLPSIFGFHPMVVTSGSMAPSVSPGDVVLLRSVPADRIGEGDVVTFRQHDGEGMTTHRVVAVKTMPDGRWIQTQGDANEIPDADLTPADAVYGEVAMRVPRVGPALLFASTPMGKLALLSVPALLLLLSEIGRFRSALRARRAGRGEQETAPSIGAPEPATRPVVASTFAFSSRRVAGRPRREMARPPARRPDIRPAMLPTTFARPVTVPPAEPTKASRPVALPAAVAPPLALPSSGRAKAPEPAASSFFQS